MLNWGMVSRSCVTVYDIGEGERGRTYIGYRGRERMVRRVISGGG